MVDLIREVLTSPFGSFGFVFALLCLGFWLVWWVTKKVTHISSDHCSLNSSVAKIDGHIDEIRRDVSYLKGSIDLLSKNPLAQSHSPLSLTELGKQISEEIGAAEIIARNWVKIQKDLDVNICNKNPYDIQQYCLEKVAIEPECFLSNADLDKLKQFAYKHGNPLQFYAPVFGIIIRDKYFEVKGINVNDIDLHDPKKINNTQEPV